MDINTSLWQICRFHQREFKLPLGFPSKAYYINYVITCIVNVFLTISTVSLNTVTILAYWRSKQLRRKTTYFLIMLLSFVDLATGLLGNSCFVLLLVKILLHDPDCTIYVFLENISLSLAGMSFMTLLLLNIERYLCIVHPFFHRNKVTKLKLFIIATALWSCAIASTLCRLFLNQIGRILTSVVILISFVSFIFIYASIFRTSQTGRRVSERSNTEHKDRNTAQDLRLAKSCAIVVGCTFLCVIPFAVTNSLAPFTFLTLSLAYWSCTLGLSSSTLNSLIFFWRNPVLRTEAKVLLRLANIKAIRNTSVVSGETTHNR
ncbi:5-hydroxytryptamine receptor 4-like [Dendronephthya gigantea]|uniref:5-hydroxytryptamine receptor 4-like n=1 Tax=Dendronephthya gigantea TaxID=151771 RepID=UPI00106CACFA|nr:5-hydroxytryptamine receptor 4-like [Dendronephthya gigantea]